MIAKLEFDCSIPEEAEKMKRMLLADDLCSVIRNFQETLRNRVKLNNNCKSGKDELLSIIQELNNQLEDKGINLDDIYN